MDIILFVVTGFPVIGDSNHMIVQEHQEIEIVMFTLMEERIAVDTNKKEK
jgi:hypothetical protein